MHLTYMSERVSFGAFIRTARWEKEREPSEPARRGKVIHFKAPQPETRAFYLYTHHEVLRQTNVRAAK